MILTQAAREKSVIDSSGLSPAPPLISAHRYPFLFKNSLHTRFSGRNSTNTAIIETSSRKKPVLATIGTVCNTLASEH